MGIRLNPLSSGAPESVRNIEDSWNKAHLQQWTDGVSVEQHLLSVPDACIDELDRVARAGNYAVTNRSTLPKSCDFAREILDILNNGVGFTIVDRFPVERYDTETNRQLIGLFSSLISPMMAQDKHGTLLYDVVDTGAEDNGTVRRSKTNGSQPFHTDGPWFDVPPKLVGLFCIEQADSGGKSYVSSLQAAVKQLSDQNEVDLSILLKAANWTRMSEHHADELPFSSLPVLDTSGSGFSMRHYADYITKGYSLAGDEVPTELSQSLFKIDAALHKFACTGFRMEAGQLQYLNNWCVAHARGAFDSDVKVNSARHLVRLWNQDSGVSARARNPESNTSRTAATV